MQVAKGELHCASSLPRAHATERPKETGVTYAIESGAITLLFS